MSPRYVLLTAVLCLMLTTTWTRAQSVRYVDDDASLGGDGTSWPTAYKYLQDALSGATAGDEIRVAGGTYKPDQDEAGNVTSGERTATFQLISGVGLYGGYAGLTNPGNPDERDIEAYETILSGDLLGDDGPDFENNAENSYHVVTGSGTDASAVIDGFTVTAGHADGPSPHDDGGGMYNADGSPTVRNCYFVGNSAIRGGAIHNSGGGAALIDCYLVGNAASNWGGAINNFSAMATLVNCVLAGNTTAGDGGAIHSDLSVVTLTNCTISGNTAGNRGGGVFNYVGVSVMLTNCILWANCDSAGNNESAQLFNNPSNSVFVNHTCMQGWTGDFGGVGNIGDDPLFADAYGPDDIPGTPDDDMSLKRDSPCINSGDPGYDPPGGTDLDGHARVLCDRVDMGAYEFGIGDYDCNQVVDLADFSHWIDCMTGPHSGPYSDDCEPLDFDLDGDVDLADFRGFQIAFAGS